MYGLWSATNVNLVSNWSSIFCFSRSSLLKIFYSFIQPLMGTHTDYILYHNSYHVREIVLSDEILDFEL
jgi:hypothetical protein